MNSKIKVTDKTAVVIGAGFAGIATALRLRALGYQVTLLERLDSLGGRAQVFERGGYRHDAGPTVITAPFLFDELFELFDEKIEEHLEFVPLDPFYRFHFADGSQFDYCASIEDTLTEIRRFSPEDADGYLKLLDKSKKVYDVAFKKLVHRPFTHVWDMVRQIPALLILECYKTVSQMVNNHLKHPLIRQAFSIHPLLVGGNPFKTTAIYTLIHYLERRWGVFFCMGGTGKLVDELGALMERQSIDILLNADVDEIIVTNNTATGVRLNNNQTINADLVVFAGDPETCYRHLLPKIKLSLPKIKKQYSMGLYVLYFGTKKLYPDVAHHSIWMGPRFKELLSEIFDDKKMSEDFSLYVHRPTATDKSFAPEGCESFYVLCPVPNLQGNVDWSTQAEVLRDRIVKALEETILPELSSVIEEVFWMTPEDFAKDYRSMHGAGFSIEPRLTQSAWFRFHNRDSAISNLYFVGAGTHPGAGLPGVISSAKVVEELLTGVEVGSGG
ncbi:MULTISPECIES: phytoene desaturase family protein [Shewanella]|uniref:phytoene desaturase family protein n=1 Tax=Shewanella TaxID=22 RepID=UPI001F351805|nr:phytoene desaturase family protein [Shewanella psychromarinicola]MCL1084043.1 phytoene desaturase family protein [Shewanella psychromarinicola]